MKQLLTRAQYKSLKKADRQEMEDFAQDMFLNGYAKGLKEGKQLSADVDIYDEVGYILDDVKGVGPKTKSNILAAIKTKFKE